MSSLFSPDVDRDQESRLDRVRSKVHKAVLRFDHRIVVQEPPRTARGSVAPVQPVAPDSSAASDLAALEHVLEDGEILIAQAWEVAKLLNQVRRACPEPHVQLVLAQAMGLHQGIVNQIRHDLRIAGHALASFRRHQIDGCVAEP